jgi:hypothetical protein
LPFGEYNVISPERQFAQRLLSEQKLLGEDLNSPEAARDIMIRTVYAEANREGDKGMEAVAWVIRNRMRNGRYGGDSVADVCLKHLQFEPWLSASGQKRIADLHTDSPEYLHIGKIVDRVMDSQSVDITGGSLYFANETTVRQRRGGSLNDWMNYYRGKGQWIPIGPNHTFYAGDPEKARGALEEREGSPSRITPNEISRLAQNTPQPAPAATSNASLDDIPEMFGALIFGLLGALIKGLDSLSPDIQLADNQTLETPRTPSRAADNQHSV